MADTKNKLTSMVNKGARKKQLKITDEMLDRLSYELNVISISKMSNYFILYSHIIEVCNELNSLHSFGRGFATGSLVNPEKIDILELDYLNKLQSMADSIDEKCHPFNLHLIDVETFKLLSNGNSEHIFQFETASMKRISKNFNPKNIIDLGKHSGSWCADFKKDSLSISNNRESHKSSVEKYIIGDRAYSNRGINIKYLLYGKEVTNSNALRRTIVLHSWDKVTDYELYPNGTAEGWGCPAVSNNSMKIIDSLLRKHQNKVLLWIIKTS